ncbi:hypothetical protein AVEN_70573-1 [Araneus ventricosus]|uniref:Uncharacterized protein n=1 Tax=Araneus ventricosus TaxID=182803 RepID=A0A4Y2PQI2_ARAVE|nr:hypothetical protein AVEN_70573-1 [Araneus ventricosus]
MASATRNNTSIICILAPAGRLTSQYEVTPGHNTSTICILAPARRLTFQFEVTPGLIWDGPLNFELRKFDADDTPDYTRSRNFHATTIWRKFSFLQIQPAPGQYLQWIFHGIGSRNFNPTP